MGVTKKGLKVYQEIPFRYYVGYLALIRYSNDKKLNSNINVEELSDLFYKDPGIPSGANKKYEIRSFLEFLSRYGILKKNEKDDYTLKGELEKDLYEHLCINGYNLPHGEIFKRDAAMRSYFPKTS